MGEYTCRMDGTNVGESVGRTQNKYQATDGRGYPSGNSKEFSTHAEILGEERAGAQPLPVARIDRPVCIQQIFRKNVRSRLPAQV